MAYYRVCPYCGAALDPGELCDCDKKTAPDAANIWSGHGESEAVKLTIKDIVTGKADSCQV